MMVLFLLFQIIIVSLSVFSLIPLADYILDQELINVSYFTKKFIYFLNLLSLKPSFIIFGSFFLITQFAISITTSLIAYFVLKIKYEFMKKMQDESLEKLMSSKWSFFTKSNYGYIQNTFIKEIEKIGHTIGHIANSIAFLFQLIIFMVVPLYIDFKITSVVILIFLSFAIFVMKVANPISQRLGKM